MTDLVCPAPPLVTVAVTGGGRFPVRRVLCVGRNYAEHAREMGADPDREPPFFFSKPADAIVTGGANIPFPPATGDLHFEIELVVAIGMGGSAIPAERATDHILGYAVGIDLTRRDLQAIAKKAGRPWDMAKGFDRSAPIGDIVRASDVGHPSHGAIQLHLDDNLRQSGDIADMIWSVPEIITELSRLISLAPGDLIFTGTPAGVGAVKAGETLTGSIDGIGSVTARIV